MTDEVLDNGLTSKLPVVPQRANGNLPKVPTVYCGDTRGDLKLSTYNIKEMNRARTEQRVVNNFSLHVYFMYVNQLEHKKGMMETILQKREMVESLSLEQFNQCVGVVLRNMV